MGSKFKAVVFWAYGINISASLIKQNAICSVEEKKRTNKEFLKRVKVDAC